MWQLLKPFFEWNDKSWLGQAIAGTVWAFPVIETIHILALTMMFGAIVIIDLRMLGFGMKKQHLPTDSWIDLFKNWLAAQDYLSPAAGG